MREALLYLLMIVVMLSICFITYYIKSDFEAEAFKRVTGKDVSTWDAVFLELRVEGCK